MPESFDPLEPPPGPPGEDTAPPGRTPSPEPSRPADIIPGILPAHQVHLLSGSPGAGKTSLVAVLVKSLLDRVPLLSTTPSRPLEGGVWVLVSDRTWADHSLWFSAAGLDLPHYSLVDDVEVTGQKVRARRGDRFDLFKDACKKLFGSDTPPWDSLLIVDPISLFLGGNLLDYDRVFTYMLDLSQFCVRHGVTILGLAHSAKQRNDPKQRYTRPQDRILGTGAQTGCAGTTLHLSPPSETEAPWYEFTWVPHHAPAATLRMARTEDGLFRPWTPDDDLCAVTDKFLDSLTARERFVTAVFPDTNEEVKYKEVLWRAHQRLQLRPTIVKRYLSECREEKLLESPRRGWWKRLPTAAGS